MLWSPLELLAVIVALTTAITIFPGVGLLLCAALRVEQRRLDNADTARNRMIGHLNPDDHADIAGAVRCDSI
ncbi:hypothetical protein FXW78_28455 [Rhodococcus opacus]|nr:hypothetical protein [Rhodococcus opacus]